MTATAIRKEIQDMIETIPEQKLKEIQSYVASLLDSGYEEPVIEPASPDEIAIIKECMDEYRANPESFRRWEDIRKEHLAQ